MSVDTIFAENWNNDGWKNIHVNTLVAENIVYGGTGTNFTNLSYVQMNGQYQRGSVMTGGTGIFNVVAAGTGMFINMSSLVSNVGTGTFDNVNLIQLNSQFLKVSNMTGGTGAFLSMVSNMGTFSSLTSGTGIFTSITSGTGTLGTLDCPQIGNQYLKSSSITGGTGTFITLSAGTGTFSNKVFIIGTGPSISILNSVGNSNRAGVVLSGNPATGVFNIQQTNVGGGVLENFGGPISILSSTGVVTANNTLDDGSGRATFKSVLSGTGVFTNVVSGTGSFTNLIAGTGTLTNLSYTQSNGQFHNMSVMTGGTGAFQALIYNQCNGLYLRTQQMTGLIGGFSLLTATDMDCVNIECGTGEFGYLFAGTGSFTALNATTMSFGTGIFSTISAGTGIFSNIVSSPNISTSTIASPVGSDLRINPGSTGNNTIYLGHDRRDTSVLIGIASTGVNNQLVIVNGPSGTSSFGVNGWVTTTLNNTLDNGSGSASIKNIAFANTGASNNTPLDYYEEYNLVTPLNGPWTDTVNITLKITRTGRVVNISWDDTSGPTYSGTPAVISTNANVVPSRFRRSTALYSPQWVNNGGVMQPSYCTIFVGTMVWYKDTSGATFGSASGTGTGCMTYSI